MIENKVLLDLSQSQHTEAGRLLGIIYHETKILDMFTREERFSYPHNGGQHTLHLKINKEELDIFLNTLRECFSAHIGLNDFIESAEVEWKKKNYVK